MGHAGLSSLLVLMLPLLLAQLQATTAARLPAQNTAELELPCDLIPLDEIKDCLCNLSLTLDSETASIIKAKLRESPGFSPSEAAMKDDRILSEFLDQFCDSTNVTITDSTTVTVTDSTSISTEESSISTSEASPSTSETSTSSSTETSTASSSSEAPPLEDLQLYTKTLDELNQITPILDDFMALMEPTTEAAHVESVASARRVWDGRDLPVAWWQRRKSSRPREVIDFCVNDNEICNNLQSQLQRIDELVGQLTGDINSWKDSDLKDLTEQREELQASYLAAEDDKDFVASVNGDAFTDVVSSVKENVESGSSAVQGKIAELSPETKNSGSTALVATLGSVGGLMVVSLIGVMIYGAAQKSKATKKLSSAKVKHEDIPIDAYAHDGPGSRRPPKMNPYSPEPVPAPRNYHHPGQFDPRREPVFPEPISGRPQQGLRRTNY